MDEGKSELCHQDIVDNGCNNSTSKENFKDVTKGNDHSLLPSIKSEESTTPSSEQFQGKNEILTEQDIIITIEKTKQKGDDLLLNRNSISTDDNMKMNVCNCSSIQNMLLLDADLPCKIISEKSSSDDLSHLALPASQMHHSTCTNIKENHETEVNVNDTNSSKCNCQMKTHLTKELLPTNPSDHIEQLKENITSQEALNVATEATDNEEKLNVTLYKPRSNMIKVDAHSSNSDNQYNQILMMNVPSEAYINKDIDDISKETLKDIVCYGEGDLMKQNTLKLSELQMQGKCNSNRSVHQSTLADDSKLVKISLPTNPMSIMQSNTHFINKSRNFLNFITEKSTNIMEKALLPQHLTMRYTSGYTNSYNESKATNIVSHSTTIKNEEENDLQSASILKHNVSSLNDSINGTSLSRVNRPLSIKPEKCINNETTQLPIARNDIAPQHNEERQEDQKKSEEDTLNLEETSLLQHPIYLTLLKDYAKAKADNIKLSEKIEALEARNGTLEAEKSGEIYKIQIETLEKTIDRLTMELRATLANQELLKKEHSAANKEMESMVMKYAVSEKQLIDAQRARDNAERRLKDIVKDQEFLQSKLRQAHGERSRICNTLDGKCREIIDLQKEIEKLKEDVQMRDVKLKWTQNKLKIEMDSQKETQQKLDKALSKINEMKEECEQVRKETQETIRKFQQSEENKAVTLDQQLKEQQARLILERHVTEDKEILRLQLQKEVETLKHRQQALVEENSMLCLKVQDYETSLQSYESTLSSLKHLADQRQKEIMDLLGKVSELETLKVQLLHIENCLTISKEEVSNLRTTNKELQSDMQSCRQREAEMLNFTQKLTDKNVYLQSELTTYKAKIKQFEDEQGPLCEQINELKNRIKLLEESIAIERKKRTEECEVLAKHLAEQTQLAQSYAQKLEDSQGENAVLRRKQQISVKEMTRELQQCRKKLEAFESSSPSNSLDIASRTGSNTSLNTGDMLNGALSDNSTNGESIIHSMGPSRQALIERIIKLQKINVRRAEKLDFLEEHTRTLLTELQKKTKIIQNYILHENAGVMSSNERDKNKAELARHGGIMASVYNQKVSDDNMTLELSLEINQKLQAVLEDALLKNITLKDNIDTLGEEIAKLTIQNQQKQLTN